jgi:hypothetical protein
MPGMPIPSRGGDGSARGADPGGRQQGSEQRRSRKGSQASEAVVFRGSELPKRERDDKPRVTLELPEEKMYSGIIPGKRDKVEHLEKFYRDKNGRANRIVWVGFIPEQTRTRIFFQTTQSADYDWSTVTEEDGSREIVLTFEKTRPSRYNFVRHIDASEYERSVERIDARKKGGTVVYTIRLGEDAPTPKVSSEGKFLFFDFPHTSKREDGDAEDADSSGADSASGGSSTGDTDKDSSD